MKRPSFQFYPADWKANAKLRRCSEAARGVWMDILGTLHDSDEYGIVRYPLAELARAAGVALRLAKELVAKGVLKGADSDRVVHIHTPRHAGKDGDPVTLVNGDGPIWFSSRMVRDEWRRQRSGGDTKFTASNQPNDAPSRSPSRRHGDGATTSSPSTSPEERKKPEDALRTPAPKEPSVEIPDWIPRDAWDGYVEMRKKIRSPMTNRAVRLMISELKKMRHANDIGAVLDQSTMSNWKRVFPVKHDNGGNNGRQSPQQSFATSISQAVRERSGESLFDSGGPEIIDITPSRNSEGDNDPETILGRTADAA